MLRIIAASALIVGAGLAHGTWTHRWSVSPALAALAARYESIPTTIGEWTSAPYELGARERAIAGAEACLGRVYTNSRRGVSVSVLLVGGHPAKIASHTPDICYRGAGYELSAPRAFDRPAGARGGPAAGFRTAVATRGGAHPSALRIYWTWRGSSGWAAPEEARWQYATEPNLTKLYVVRETGGAAIDPDRDPCNEFLDVLLPELDRAVFPTAG
jgi:hypothetical protein